MNLIWEYLSTRIVLLVQRSHVLLKKAYFRTDHVVEQWCDLGTILLEWPHHGRTVREWVLVTLPTGYLST